MRRPISLLIIAVLIAVAAAYSSAGAASAPACSYPTVSIWLDGGGMVVRGGGWASYPCPAGKHPAHRLIIVRHRGRLTIKMAPVSAHK